MVLSCRVLAVSTQKLNEMGESVRGSLSNAQVVLFKEKGWISRQSGRNHYGMVGVVKLPKPYQPFECNSVIDGSKNEVCIASGSPANENVK
ncbi:MAG: hypothetical protein H7Z75_05190 [Ferruginibacter sp.]|nr:hypothetical protein [Cytophagales bacterium]